MPQLIETIPRGELVKIMEGGTVTLPAKYRNHLGLKKGEVVSVILVDPFGMLITPIEIIPKKRGADWTTDTAAEYMRKVRYNVVEKMRASSAKKAW